MVFTSYEGVAWQGGTHVLRRGCMVVWRLRLTKEEGSGVVFTSYEGVARQGGTNVLRRGGMAG